MVKLNDTQVFAEIVLSHLEEKIDCSPKGKNLMHWLKVTVCKIGSHL